MKKKKLLPSIRKNYILYLLLLPVIIYLIIFKYVPMFGIVIAFKDFVPRQGIWGSAWVGLKHFNILFGGTIFPKVLRNTIVLSLLRFICEFPAPIILALMLNEIQHTGFKRVAQTFVYMPHFLSWVIAGSLVLIVVDSDGIINYIMSLFGMDLKSSLLVYPKFTYPVLIISNIWKEAGWGTLLYLAAMSGIDPQLYEAAILDGATRFKQMLYITIPSISSTIVVLMILRTGKILNAGFEEVFLLQNVMNLEVSEILDTYVYKMGIRDGKYSLSTAVGLFKSVVGLFMILGSNALARKFGDSSLL